MPNTNPDPTYLSQRFDTGEDAMSAEGDAEGCYYAHAYIRWTTPYTVILWRFTGRSWRDGFVRATTSVRAVGAKSRYVRAALQHVNRGDAEWSPVPQPLKIILDHRHEYVDDTAIVSRLYLWDDTLEPHDGFRTT